MFEIIFAELHTQLFLAGSNLGTKLDPSKRTLPADKSLKLSYDPIRKWLIVNFNGKACFIPESNIVSAQPKNPDDLGLKDLGTYVAPLAKVTTSGAAMKKGAAHTAQVETPHGLDRSKL